MGENLETIRTFEDDVLLLDHEIPDGEAGFTLVEVLVTVAIISLVVGFIAFNTLPMFARAKVDTAKADIQTLQTALEAYSLQMNGFPTEQDGLQALRTAPSNVDEASYPRGGFIKKLPTDPWNNPYQYRYPGDHGVFDVFSFGADGEPGGEGDNADVVSWEVEE